MANKHTKIYSTPLIEGIQIKITTRYYSMPIRMAYI